MEPILGWVLLGLLVVWRLAEVAISARNVKALVAAGGRFPRRDVTGLLVLLHTGTLTGIAIERLLGARIGGTASLVAALVLVVATAGRLWTLGTLGRRWTICVVTLPGEPPVTTGPYRFLRHPNYVVILMEILAIPALFHAWWTLAIGTLPHALGLVLRVRVEDEAWRVETLRSAPRP